MPRENRKRGKKHKHPKSVDAANVTNDLGAQVNELEGQAGPSWILPSKSKLGDDFDSDAPFGYVDADVKAYFRTVDLQIRNWEEEAFDMHEYAEDIDPNEERRLFFVAALTEMSGKEKQLATDPDCSGILERMLYSMDDFARRVFVDRLTGSYEILMKHRFASHVCQTLFSVAVDTVSRESRNVLPQVPDSAKYGELRTLTQSILDICDEMNPSFIALIMDPFGSHVIRALLLLLCPSLTSDDGDSSKGKSNVRSKKSAAWKSRQQGSIKPLFTTQGGGDQVGKTKNKDTPPQFCAASRAFLHLLLEKLGENEVRALAANQVACPVLKMMLEIEADHNESDTPDSLMDQVLVGIITACHQNLRTPLPPSDYLSTLFRDLTSSHLLETLVSRAPGSAFDMIWSTYFHSKLPKLAVHPVANFVVAKALARANAAQLEDALDELKDSWGKIIKLSRTGVLRAIIDRAGTLRAHESKVVESVVSTFKIPSRDDVKNLVPLVMTLGSSNELTPVQRPANPGNKAADDDPNEPKIQGALILQSLLRLSDPHNRVVIESIQSMSADEIIAFAHNATSSRVLDVLLDSTTVPHRVKRSFVLSLIGHFYELVDDRIGSRVGDRCWAFADPYLREKIARSVMPQESFLAGSYYGKFFARNLNLPLLQRRPDEWKDLQSRNKLASMVQAVTAQPAQNQTKESHEEATTAEIPPAKSKKRRREARQDDEIEALFNSVIGKKVKKGALDVDVDKPPHPPAVSEKGLEGVFGAIRNAPKDFKKS